MTANQAHTPTTEQVRELYAVDEWGVSHDEYRAEFDRWLAERDARIIAAAEQRGAIKAWPEGYMAALNDIEDTVNRFRADAMEGDDE